MVLDILSHTNTLIRAFASWLINAILLLVAWVVCYYALTDGAVTALPRILQIH